MSHFAYRNTMLKKPVVLLSTGKSVKATVPNGWKYALPKLGFFSENESMKRVHMSISHYIGSNDSKAANLSYAY